MATGNEELDEFKSQINLCEYAASQGFALDRKLSSKRNAVMRNSKGDKIAIVRKSSGHWVYCNVHGDDSGSIIDFVKAQKSFSIGQVRRELRSWGNGSNLSPIQAFDESLKLVASKSDSLQVIRNWSRAREPQSSDYYLRSRGIVDNVLLDPIFIDRIRIDNRRNTIFPHWNASGELSGFEIKNKDFTGFSPGGEKGLWCSRPQSNDEVMVVCESAIDALSVATIFDTDRKRFFSTAGKCNPNQVACLISAAKQFSNRPAIWLAFDNDEAGRGMAADIRHEFMKIFEESIDVLDKMPNQANTDWNDVVRSKTECANVVSTSGAFQI